MIEYFWSEDGKTHRRRLTSQEYVQPETLRRMFGLVPDVNPPAKRKYANAFKLACPFCPEGQPGTPVHFDGILPRSAFDPETGHTAEPQPGESGTGLYLQFRCDEGHKWILWFEDWNGDGLRYMTLEDVVHAEIEVHELP